MHTACGGVYSGSRYTPPLMVLLVIHVSLVHEDRSRSDRLPVAARRTSTSASSTRRAVGVTSLAASWYDQLVRRGARIRGARQGNIERDLVIRFPVGQLDPGCRYAETPAICRVAGIVPGSGGVAALASAEIHRELPVDFTIYHAAMQTPEVWAAFGGSVTAFLARDSFRRAHHSDLDSPQARRPAADDRRAAGTHQPYAARRPSLPVAERCRQDYHRGETPQGALPHQNDKQRIDYDSVSLDWVFWWNLATVKLTDRILARQGAEYAP